jgi:hypothetical protein
MSAPSFIAYKEHSLDMGTVTVTSSAPGFDLTGSVAKFIIGKMGQPALLQWLSSDPPDEGLFTWNDTTRQFAIDVPASVFEALELGRFWYRVTITTASGVPLPPPFLGHIVLDDVPRSI